MGIQELLSESAAINEKNAQAIVSTHVSPLPDSIKVVANWGVTNDNQIVLAPKTASVITGSEFVELTCYKMFPPDIRALYDKSKYLIATIQPRYSGGSSAPKQMYTHAIEMKLGKILDAAGKFLGYGGSAPFTIAYNQTADKSDYYTPSELQFYPSITGASRNLYLYARLDAETKTFIVYLRDGLSSVDIYNIVIFSHVFSDPIHEMLTNKSISGFVSPFNPSPTYSSMCLPAVFKDLQFILPSELDSLYLTLGAKTDQEKRDTFLSEYMFPFAQLPKYIINFRTTPTSDEYYASKSTLPPTTIILKAYSDITGSSISSPLEITSTYSQKIILRFAVSFTFEKTTRHIEKYDFSYVPPKMVGITTVPAVNMVFNGDGKYKFLVEMEGTLNWKYTTKTASDGIEVIDLKNLEGAFLTNEGRIGFYATVGNLDATYQDIMKRVVSSTSYVYNGMDQAEELKNSVAEQIRSLRFIASYVYFQPNFASYSTTVSPFFSVTPETYPFAIDLLSIKGYVTQKQVWDNSLDVAKWLDIPEPSLPSGSFSAVLTYNTNAYKNTTAYTSAVQSIPFQVGHRFTPKDFTYPEYSVVPWSTDMFNQSRGKTVRLFDMNSVIDGDPSPYPFDALLLPSASGTSGGISPFYTFGFKSVSTSTTTTTDELRRH